MSEQTYIGQAKNEKLSSAKKAKNDEFYTQFTDINAECCHYKEQFKGKTVFLNCDDPMESNFWIYFYKNFIFFGMKCLISTHFEKEHPTYALVLTADQNYQFPEGVGDLTKQKETAFEDITENGKTVRLYRIKLPLKQNGDFRSDECIALLKSSDIVCTNPPFSLFREYVAQLIQYEKEFLIIGNMNAITYKEIFPLLKDNKMWIGYGFNQSFIFKAPYENTSEDNKKYVKSKGYDPDDHFIGVPAIAWFTNMAVSKRSEPLDLVIHYYDYYNLDGTLKKDKEDRFPKYDNYDAINCEKVTDIPDDYYGEIGVPITFLDKYNPDQFEIIGMTKTPIGNHLRSKVYGKQIQHNPNGTTQIVTKANDGAVIEIKEPLSDKPYYEIEGKLYKAVYPRILIKRRG